MRYDGSQFNRDELMWTQHVFLQVQLLIWDRSLYDPEKGEYTVNRFLDETENRIGPVDAVLIWHVYPNLGVDDRNQFDLLRDLPGGIPGLREMVQQFHRRNVKVFFPFIAWDTGTREEEGPRALAMCRLLKDIGADGINFDTLESPPAEFLQASETVGHPQPFECRSAALGCSTATKFAVPDGPRGTCRRHGAGSDPPASGGEQRQSPAVEAALNGKPAETAEAPAIGCRVRYARERGERGK